MSETTTETYTEYRVEILDTNDFWFDMAGFAKDNLPDAIKGRDAIHNAPYPARVVKETTTVTIEREVQP